MRNDGPAVVDFSKVNFAGYDLSRMRLEGADLDRANLTNVNLLGVHLRCASFSLQTCVTQASAAPISRAPT